MQKPLYTWMAFLAMTFAVVGLVGFMGVFATPLPLERAIARETTLDQARSAAHGPDAAKALEALRPRLDDSAAAILTQGGDIDAKIQAERMAMRARFQAEADAVAVRMRWMIGMVTLMGAVFGAALMKLAGNSAR